MSRRVRSEMADTGGPPPPPRGTLPNLSLAAAHGKADRYALGDLHRQSNAAAKQAILQELHSSMQLRAEKIRLQHRGSAMPGIPHHGGEDDANPLFGAAGKGRAHVPEQPRARQHPSSGGHAKQVTFAEPHLHVYPRGSPARGQSRIPVPVRGESSTGHGSHGQPVAGHGQVGHRGGSLAVRSGGQRREDGRGKREDDNYQYTWGLRGRLNELRIRCLARKFFSLWQRNALTGVRPSVVRKHYNTRLLRRTFDEWREFWWTLRREWTLLIRAEYHHRYKIYQHVWQSWRAYVFREKVKAAKKEIASTHASGVLLRRVVAVWQEYVRQRRAKAARRQKAQKFSDRRALQLHWDAWKGAIHQCREEREAEIFALQYWAESVTQKAWEAWRRRYRERQELKEKEAYARQVYEKTLVARCFHQGLVQYTLHRRDRRQRNAHASQLYKDRVLLQGWQHWNQRWFTRRSLALRQEQVDRLGNQARMRRVLTHWRFYIHLLQIERLKEDSAKAHRNTQLMRYGLLSLKLAVVQRRVKIRRTYQAVEFHQETLVKRCWNRWMVQCEHSEELRMFSASRKARLMHRRRLLGAAMQKWCDYTKWRRHRKAQYLRAEVHFALQVLPKCLHRLGLNVELERRKRELRTQASQFYREGLLCQYFYRWWRGYQTSQDVRMMERMAFLHHESVVAKRFFHEWRERTRDKLKESEKLCLASDHYHTSLCVRTLDRWMEFIREARQRSEYERVAAVHDYMKTAKKAWTIWREYIVQRRHKASKKRKADSYYQRKQLKQTFTAWKIHSREMQGVYQTVAARESVVNHRRLKYAFTEWKQHTESAREEHTLERAAIMHWETKLMHGVMTAWHGYAGQHAADAAIKDWRVEQLRMQLNKGKLRRALLSWRDCAQTAAEDARQEERADAFRNRKLEERCLQRWRNFRLLCLKKMLITRQALWLNKIRMQSKFLSRWKHQHGEARDENRRTVMALWLWSMRLQQRTLRAWICHAQEQRRKKDRIAAALEQRRLELLREGVRQWLAVAASLGERRAAIAAKHHAQSSYKSYQVVQRCATHWRQRTLANRGKQKRPPKSSAGRRVTFQDEAPIGGQRSMVAPPAVAQSSGATMPQPAVSSRLPVLSSSVEDRSPLGDVDGLPSHISARPVTGKMRPQPRRPDFLRDSLKREGLWKQSPMKVQSNHSKLQPDRASQDDTLPASMSSRPDHPSDVTWIKPSPENQPIPPLDPNVQDVPCEPRGGIAGREKNGQDSNLQMMSSQSAGVAASFEADGLDSESETDGASCREEQSRRDNGEHEHRSFPMHISKGSEDERHKDFKSNLPVKPTVLLPPSVFASSGSSDASRGKPPLQPDRGNKLHPPLVPHSPQTSTLTTPGVGGDGAVTKETLKQETKEDVYVEIQRLKKTLQGYQDMKSRLKELQHQEAELEGWLKELNLPSSVEDSAALLIGDELTQVQDEIAKVTDQVLQSKPHIRGLLARITQLTQQAAI